MKGSSHELAIGGTGRPSCLFRHAGPHTGRAVGRAVGSDKSDEVEWLDVSGDSSVRNDSLRNKARQALGPVARPVLGRIYHRVDARVGEALAHENQNPPAAPASADLAELRHELERWQERHAQVMATLAANATEIRELSRQVEELRAAAAPAEPTAGA